MDIDHLLLIVCQNQVQGIGRDRGLLLSGLIDIFCDCWRKGEQIN